MFIIKFVLHAVVGIITPKEGKIICYPIDVEGLILLYK